jgi:hypothetical protein
MKKAILLFLITTGTALSSCKEKEEVIPPAIIKETSNTEDIPRPTSYGNGVYYFKCVGTEFAEALALFRSSDTTLKVVTVTTHTTINNGEQGYIVVMDKK